MQRVVDLTSPCRKADPMETRPVQPSCVLPTSALARFMPMHLLLDRDGRVISLGPTLAKVLGGPKIAGASFSDLFDVRAPAGYTSVNELVAGAGDRIRLVVKSGSRVGLRGLGMPVSAGDHVLINLSFGIDLISAVREFALSDADFAATELAMELLYLAEANAAVTRELRGFNLRLEGARLAAEEEALTDPLTGLRNRRAADLLLERLCKAGAPFGLLHMDLDYFKAVNDSLGHAAGDLVLAEVGRILRDQIRAEDCAARIGGDEFVVILCGRTDPAVLLAVAERIIARVSEPIDFEGSACRVSASVGIVQADGTGSRDPTQVLSAADRALYAAKHAGRSRAVLFPAQQD
jgi:diguanylate cyclase (GGDEF)-like protein